MVDIQSPTAEIRREKKKERKRKPQGENILSASATQGGHNYYLRQGEYVIVVVCLSACLLTTLRKTCERICMKFSGKVVKGPMNKRLNIGGDPDHGSGSVKRHW